MVGMLMIIGRSTADPRPPREWEKSAVRNRNALRTTDGRGKNLLRDWTRSRSETKKATILPRQSSLSHINIIVQQVFKAFSAAPP